MNRDWENRNWGDIASLEYGKSLRDYRMGIGKYRVFGTNGPIGWHTKPLWNQPGVIIGRKGAYRGVHYSPEPFFVIDTAFYLEPKIEFDMRWAYFSLLTIDINSMDSGSAIPSTSRDDFYSLPLSLPPLPEQKRIAHILGTLDDKIELNRRMNETLEAAARALFKSWFVDFDPVRYKLAGKDPCAPIADGGLGIDPQTAAIFPDKLVPSSLGMIPEGWGVGFLSEEIDIIGGGTPKTRNPEFWNGKIPWYSVVDAPNHNDVWVVKTEKHITQKGLDGSSARLLPIGTSIISARGTVGKIALTGVEMAMNQSCYGIRGASGRGDFYIYFRLRLAVEHLQQMTHGSVFDTITRKTFDSVEIALPPMELVERFNHEVQSKLELVLQNNLQSQTLASIRDALLPKLISGEIELGEECYE